MAAICSAVAVVAASAITYLVVKFRKNHDGAASVVNIRPSSGYIEGELPDEVLHHIFRHLATNDLARCSRVCRAWYHTATQNTLWSRFAQPRTSSIRPACDFGGCVWCHLSRQIRNLCDWRSGFSKYFYVPRGHTTRSHALQLAVEVTGFLLALLLMKSTATGTSVHACLAGLALGCVMPGVLYPNHSPPPLLAKTIALACSVYGLGAIRHALVARNTLISWGWDALLWGVMVWPGWREKIAQAFLAFSRSPLSRQVSRLSGRTSLILLGSAFGVFGLAGHWFRSARLVVFPFVALIQFAWCGIFTQLIHPSLITRSTRGFISTGGFMLAVRWGLLVLLPNSGFESIFPLLMGVVAAFTSLNANLGLSLIYVGTMLSAIVHYPSTLRAPLLVLFLYRMFFSNLSVLPLSAVRFRPCPSLRTQLCSVWSKLRSIKSDDRSSSLSTTPLSVSNSSPTGNENYVAVCALANQRRIVRDNLFAGVYSEHTRMLIPANHSYNTPVSTTCHTLCSGYRVCHIDLGAPHQTGLPISLSWGVSDSRVLTLNHNHTYELHLREFPSMRQLVCSKLSLYHEIILPSGALTVLGTASQPLRILRTETLEELVQIKITGQRIATGFQDGVLAVLRSDSCSQPFLSVFEILDLDTGVEVDELYSVDLVGKPFFNQYWFSSTSLCVSSHVILIFCTRSRENQNYIYAYETRTGIPLWHCKVGSGQPFLGAGGLAVISRQSAQIEIRDAYTGVLKCVLDISSDDNTRSSSSPACMDAMGVGDDFITLHDADPMYAGGGGERLTRVLRFDTHVE